MNLKQSFLLLSFILGLAMILSGCGNSNAQVNNTNDNSNSISQSRDLPMSKASQAAEKIEVVHFHATQQCWSCKTVGEFALKTIKEKFPEEYKNGTIVFKDINGELPENRDLVIKYQASGSSLFINAITNGQDKIEEDVTVWRLINNESQFVNYFENKLKTLLGK
jgi:ABC-type glycerol-3-phosphate transport system substrate-binding protein